LSAIVPSPSHDRAFARGDASPGATLRFDGAVEALGLRRESTRIVDILDIGFCALFAAVAAADVAALTGLPVSWPLLPGPEDEPLLALGTAACASWVLVRAPSCWSRWRDRW
jgi:hypothetical protein